MDAVGMLSGGAGSWLACRRWIDQHGPGSLRGLFADTRMEDADLYRFLDDATAELDIPLVRLADGRTPWQVFHDDRFLGNAKLANCSKFLKQIPAKRWVEEHTDPRATVIVVGVGGWERHRLADIEAGYYPWTVAAPLLDKPAPTQRMVLDAVRAAGLEPPRAYALGFKHNNCGGACVRGGRGQWANLLRVFPDRYREAEAQEQALRQYLGKDVAILRDRAGGETQPMTLREWRTRLERQAELQPSLFELLEDDEPGGCGIMGCGIGAPADTPAE
jgi:hypothetical protein